MGDLILFCQEMRRPKSMLGKILLGVVLIAALLGAAFWVITFPFRGVMAYDKKTTELGRLLGDFTTSQWEQVYHDSEVIFLAHDKKERRALTEDEFPIPLQGLAFDQFFVDDRGVFFKRVGGGWSEGNTTQVHSVHSPDMRQHDRKGVWLDGFRVFEWVYEHDQSTGAEQGAADQLPARQELKSE